MTYIVEGVRKLVQEMRDDLFRLVFRKVSHREWTMVLRPL